MNGFEELEDTDISKVNSYSASDDGLHLILSAETGIFIVSNTLFTYKWYFICHPKLSQSKQSLLDIK
jgi:hypothetical protein